MAHNTFKLLTATTALLALASGAALADDVNSNNTATLLTSSTTTGFNISGSTVISNTTGLAAIEVSGTTAQSVILISSSATVQGNAVSGTIVSMADVATGANATIDNKGAINAIGGNAIAIDLSTYSSITTITNSGTISGSVTTGTGNDVLTNTGTITGAVDLDDGNNAMTVSGTSALVTGAVSAGTGNDTLTVSGGDIVGAVNLSSGNNTITVSGSTASITGNVTTTSGNDTLNISNSLITGNVDLGAGSNVINITGSSGKISGTVTGTTGTDNVSVVSGTITGAIDLGDTGANSITGTDATFGSTITGGDNNDTLTLTRSTVTGAVDLEGGTNTITATGTTFTAGLTTAGSTDTVTLVNSSVGGAIALGTGTDELNISGTTAFTTKGAITGAEALNISTTEVTLNHAVLDGSNATFAIQGATVHANVDQTGSGTDLTVNNGTFNIAAGKTVTVDNAVFSNAGVLGIAVADSSTAGLLVASTAFTGVSTTINLASTAGYIASGTTYQIINAGTLNAMPSLTTTTQGLYTFSLGDDGNNGVSLTILRAAANSVATNTGNAAVGSVLENISQTTNTQLLAVQSALSNAGSTAAVNNVLESLLPAASTGAVMANVGTSTATGNQVSDRLAMLRGRGMNTGDGMFSNHFWVQGFGNVTNQDDKDGVKGYDATGWGTSAGVDTNSLIDGVTTGLAFSYGNASVESNATGNANTDINSYLVTGYGSSNLGDGVFVNGQASVGVNNYETDRTISGVGVAHGDFDGMQYGLKAELGRDYDYEAWTLTPMVSAQYTHVDMDGYTETGAGGAGLVVGDQDFDALDLGAGAQLAWNMPLENGGVLKPMLRAKYVYRAGDATVESTARFIGGGSTFTSQGVKSDRSSINLGTGLMLSTVAGVDLTLDYDADIRDSLVGHTGQLKARWAF